MTTRGKTNLYLEEDRPHKLQVPLAPTGGRDGHTAVQEHIKHKEQYDTTRNWWSYTTRPEQPNTDESEEKDLKNKFKNMLEALKEERKKFH